MIINIIFAACIYPILPIIYIVMKMNSEPKKNVVLGVTVPSQYLESEEVVKICNIFKRELRKYMIICAVIPIAFFFVKYVSIATSLWMIWMLGMIVMVSWPYVKCNKLMSHLKIEKGWNIESAGKTMIDMKAVNENIRTVNLPMYITAAVLGLIPVIYEAIQATGRKGYWAIITTMISMWLVTLICLWIGIIMDHQKVEIISQNSDINSNYNRAKKRIWSKCWQNVAWANTAYMIALWAFMEAVIPGVILFMILSMLFTIVIVFICIRAGLTVKKIQQKIIREYGAADEVLGDDDASWIFGMIYYNPNDKHTTVDKRAGIGTTINMATTGGKWITGFSALAILTIPIVCIALIFEEFTPINLEVKNNQIIAEHLKQEYAVDIDTITEMELITKLPTARKNNGTDVGNLDKGSFSIEGYGDCDVCVNPENTAFIVIKTQKDTYIFNDTDNADTQKVYDEILNIKK